MSKQLNPGDEIICIGNRGLDNLTRDKTYRAIYGKEAGIFETRPFVTVIDDNAKKYCCHLSRFKGFM